VLSGLTQLHSHLFWHSRGGLVSPDIQPLCFHVPLYSAEWMSGPDEGFTILPGIIRPVSRGSIRLASGDPDDAPLVDPAFLRCGADLDALLAALEICREMSRAGPLQEWGAKELYPGPELETEQELREYICRTVLTYHHQVGTCKMGVDAEAVVDPELRVYGTTGLRVADASIMPSVTSGNTFAPAVMIGERAADLVRESLSSAAKRSAVPA
jgi:choline dehydrogenase